MNQVIFLFVVLVIINKAKTRRNIDQPLIIHSDRGSQYVAKEYKKATENMQRSYSKKAFPWDNAWMESFILFSSVNGSIALKFAITSRHTDWFSNIWKLFTTRNEFTVIATLCHQMNPSEYIKEHTLRRSCWQVEFGRNLTFQLVLNFYIGSLDFVK